jgi:hypothetical protein
MLPGRIGGFAAWHNLVKMPVDIKNRRQILTKSHLNVGFSAAC